jgi:hypothetical protein
MGAPRVWRTLPALRGPLVVCGLLALYCVPTLLFFYPAWTTLTRRLIGDAGDPTFNLYILKWGAHQVRLGLPDFWNANFMYPVRGTLAFSDHLLAPALQLVVLQKLDLVANAIAGYNLLLVSSFVLSGAATCWVLRRGGRSRAAAVVGGLLFAFAPMRWAHLDHIQILLAQWVPLTLWYWDRLLAQPSARRAACFLPFYLLHVTGGCYLAYMIHVPMLALAVSRRPRSVAELRRLVAGPGLRVLLAVAVPAAATVYWLFSPYVEAARRYGLERSPAEVVLYAASLLSYLAPAETNWYAGGWHRLVDRWQLEVSLDEGRLFAGFVATALCACGLALWWRRHRRRPSRPLAGWQRAVLAALLLAAAAAFVIGDVRTFDPEAADTAWNVPALVLALSLGLWLAARRRWGGAGPLAWAGIDPWERGLAAGGALCFLLSFPIVFVPLRGIVPGLGGLRAPGRFYAITSFVVVWFAAAGCDALLARLAAAAERRGWGGSRRVALRLAAAAVLVVAAVVDLAPSDVTTRRLRAEPDFPAVYAALRALPEGEVGGILELPRLRPVRETLYMYYSTLHWKPIANGYSGFLPERYLELRERIPLLPEGDAAFDLVRRSGITHLVVHAGGQPGRPIRDQLPAWEHQYLNRAVRCLYDDGTDRIYRIVDPIRPPLLAEAVAPGAVAALGDR